LFFCFLSVYSIIEGKRRRIFFNHNLKALKKLSAQRGEDKMKPKTFILGMLIIGLTITMNSACAEEGAEEGNDISDNHEQFVRKSMVTQAAAKNRFVSRQASGDAPVLIKSESPMQRRIGPCPVDGKEAVKNSEPAWKAEPAGLMVDVNGNGRYDEGEPRMLEETELPGVIIGHISKEASENSKAPIRSGRPGIPVNTTIEKNPPGVMVPNPQVVTASQIIASEILQRNAVVGAQVSRQDEVRQAGAIQKGDMAPSCGLTVQVMREATAKSG
jgi:hypothetical protein